MFWKSGSVLFLHLLATPVSFNGPRLAQLLDPTRTLGDSGGSHPQGMIWRLVNPKIRYQWRLQGL